MAIDMQHNGDLGCAYYVAVDEVLHLLEDVAMASTDLIETLLLHSHPTTILLSARAPEILVQALERNSEGPDAALGLWYCSKHSIRNAYILRSMNSADFHYESAREKLSKLDIDQLNQQSMHYATVVDDDNHAIGEPGGESHQGHMLRLGATINAESKLARRRSTQYLPDHTDAMIEMFSLFNSMFINADTIIMQPEFHPNSHQRGSGTSNAGSKESLSIYGLFHRHARTKQGRAKLRQIFLRPSLDVDLIRSRQHAIAFLSQPSYAESIGALSKALGKIGNMKSCMGLLRKGGRKVSVYNNRFAAYTLQIRDLIQGMPGAAELGLASKITATIDPVQVRHVGDIITQTIDFEQSEERGRTAVRHGVDVELDELKRSYDGMEHFLTRVLASLRQQLPEWARTYIQNCSFLPQLGFLTVVTLEPKTGKGCYDGEGSEEPWECIFAADGCVYYKNMQMREMDAQFGDAYCMIIDREIEIIHSLSVSVLEHEASLVAISEVLGELDSMLALALGSCQQNWIRPQITLDNVIEIQGGRHPLQELVVPSFIANDCYLAGGIDQPLSSSVEQHNEKDHPSTLVLTGPNHSGKSVYLKQVALIVYLAQIGCYVPAENAIIGITDRILTRVATRESVGRNESAFSIDLRQVAFSINFATPRSLILVDEFGKGTDSLDGIGLMTALLDHFTSLGEQRPKVLAATHFHEIFDSDFLHGHSNLALAHMDIHLDLHADISEEQLVPGRSTSSFGSRCAALNGISDAIVARAEELVLLQARDEDLEVACSILTEEESHKLEMAEHLDLTPRPRESTSARQPDLYRNMLRQIFNDNTVGLSDA
ncbi:muts domain V-domain-containing protein [Microdochium trichocladiopsis]|uniref:DNA mismatch repair protein MSH5 n=1 Tax=Microdochium trichocladiopsis TaxID=1682393 RepID=A0A9P9BR82_9PEZI|nr:muts domain V-domain-containing protein [Microdochium trichocladiopsis]KAH7031595.1 muts domain V-domain-containing protein [Microdochium trichocladiopsis]